MGTRFAALAAFVALMATACTSQPHDHPAEDRGDVIREMSTSEPTAALNHPTLRRDLRRREYGRHGDWPAGRRTRHDQADPRLRRERQP